jgi:hypothetical protein
MDDRNSQIFEDDNPWNHPPEQYALAITGKAFNTLVENEKYHNILKKVIMKA